MQLREKAAAFRVIDTHAAPAPVGGEKRQEEPDPIGSDRRREMSQFAAPSFQHSYLGLLFYRWL